jgi:alanyl-tRNA synthetase
MMEQKRWPFHPKPLPYESVHSWIKRIAIAHDVTFSVFCRKGLDLTSEEAKILKNKRTIPEHAIIKLHIGTGQPIETIKDMLPGRLVERLNKGVEELEKRNWGKNILERSTAQLILFYSQARIVILLDYYGFRN